jgi:hypothetical protein
MALVRYTLINNNDDLYFGFDIIHTVRILTNSISTNKST